MLLITPNHPLPWVCFYLQLLLLLHLLKAKGQKCCAGAAWVLERSRLLNATVILPRELLSALRQAGNPLLPSRPPSGAPHPQPQTRHWRWRWIIKV